MGYQGKVIDPEKVKELMNAGWTKKQIVDELAKEGFNPKSIYKVYSKVERKQAKESGPQEEQTSDDLMELLNKHGLGVEKQVALLADVAKNGSAANKVAALRLASRIAGLHEKKAGGNSRTQTVNRVSFVPKEQLDAIGGVQAGIESGRLIEDGYTLVANPNGPPLPAMPPYKTQKPITTGE